MISLQKKKPRTWRGEYQQRRKYTAGGYLPARALIGSQAAEAAMRVFLRIATIRLR